MEEVRIIVHAPHAAISPLFVDWCAATGRDPVQVGEEDLDVFARDVPASDATLARRLHALRSALGIADPDSRPGEPQAPCWRAGPGWRTLNEALPGCPTSRWPTGFTGRRDAWMLVLAAPVEHGGLGMSRSRVTSVTSADISTEGGDVRVGGRSPGRAEDPAACPACAVVRWLQVISLAQTWGRNVVREHMVLAPEEPDGHVCETGVDEETITRLGHGWPLTPAIDQHGWVTTWRPLSARSVSAVLASRLSRLVPRAAPPEAPAEDEDAEFARNLTGIDEGRLDVLLDAAAHRADEANRRAMAAMEEAAGSLVNPPWRLTSRTPKA